MLGQSTDLRVWQYVDRGVVLAWTQTYPDEAMGRNVSEYRVFDGAALLESVTPDASGVVTSCENASEPCTFPPCNDECYSAELRVTVPNLHSGTMHNLSVDAVFSLEGKRRLSALNSKPSSPNPTPKTPSHKPRTLRPKPQSPTPTPQTVTTKPQTRWDRRGGRLAI
jgi:hypothetical protein